MSHEGEQEHVQSLRPLARIALAPAAKVFGEDAVYTQLKSEGYDVRYMRPKEGLLGWAEALMLMKDRSGDTQKAYDFVDAWLSAGTAKWIIENYGYGHANMVGIEMASDAVRPTSSWKTRSGL